MKKRAALILAGGRARRFQKDHCEWQDKALANLSGKPLIVHDYESVNEVVDEIVICVNDENRKIQYSKILSEYNIKNVKIVADEKINHISGPNVAILSGLKAVEAEYCFTLPCDMPLFKPAVIDYLFDAAKGCDVLVPMWPDGRLETLTTVLRTTHSLDITNTLCHLRRPRSDDIMRGALHVQFISPLYRIKAIDPTLESFVNINRFEDLKKLQTRKIYGRPVGENVRLTLSPFHKFEVKQLLDAGSFWEKNNNLRASEIFSACASRLEKEKSFFWAGLSREYEGETLLALSKHQTDSNLAKEQDSKAKDAYAKAANNFVLESEIYEKAHCSFLTNLAMVDSLWCESWSKGRPLQSHRYPPKG